LEGRLRTQFLGELQDFVTRALEEQLPTDATLDSPGHRTRLPKPLIFGIRNIRYRSLHFDLAMPNIDSALDAVGANLDLLQCILGAYIPRAFSDTFGVAADDFRFNVEVPTPPTSANGEKAAPPANADISKDNKQSATRFLVQVIQSPLIFPILLILMLWYFARQDTMQERQMLNALMTTLLQQQTETIRVIKDAIPRPQLTEKAETKASQTASDRK
jgi:hypothetical protein